MTGDSSFNLSPMKMLVMGGMGFIGSHIVDSYIADGYGIVVMR